MKHSGSVHRENWHFVIRLAEQHSAHRLQIWRPGQGAGTQNCTHTKQTYTTIKVITEQ